MQSYKRPLKIDELDANRYMVSAHKYGFFLCRAGTARILLGDKVYRISRNRLCIYTPNTLFKVFAKSPDLEGILEEYNVDTCYPAVGSINIRKRLQIRNAPCVEISDEQSDAIVRLVGIFRENACVREEYDSVSESNRKTVREIHDGCLRHLRYALCLKILEIYFADSPVEALPETKEDAILNRFLASVYENGHCKRTVQYYADEQHLSPYYFSSIIKERSGKSAMQWIENVTMIFARQYLACSEMSIKEISDRLNFPDQSTFGRYFKHREGCSPSEFRSGKTRAIYKP